MIRVETWIRPHLLAGLARARRPVGTGEIWLVRVVRAVRIGSGAIDEAAIA